MHVFKAMLMTNDFLTNYNLEEFVNINVNARLEWSEFDEVFHQQMTGKQS
jgi:hypothetical protein